MPGTVSLGRTLVLAALFHVGAFALVGRARTPVPEAIPGDPMKLVWVEATPEVDVAPAARGLEASEPADLAVAHATAPHGRIAPTAVPVASVLALPESAPTASGGWTLNVTSGNGATSPSAPTLASLGLDGKNHFLGGREGTPEPDPARVANERSNRAAGEAMREALHDGDVALGMGGSGPVVTALEEAVLAGTAPVESHAVLVAIADASGLVTQVVVESASEDLASFRAIAEDVLGRMRDKKVRVPSSSRGLAMRLDVISRLAAPSGGGVGLDPRHAGLSFDLSDIGAHVGRIVHARVLGESLL
jgi:hypothetical protein